MCSDFHEGPCFPDGASVGQTLRLKLAASEEIGKDKPPKDRRDEGQLVNTLHDMFAALRVCWLPPPPDQSRPGMEYTIRFAFKSDGELMAPVRVTYATHGVPEEVPNVYHEAVEAAFRRCTPMHFSTGMAGAIAGRPFPSLLRRSHHDRAFQTERRSGQIVEPFAPSQTKAGNPDKSGGAFAFPDVL